VRSDSTTEPSTRRADYAPLTLYPFPTRPLAAPSTDLRSAATRQVPPAGRENEVTLLQAARLPVDFWWWLWTRPDETEGPAGRRRDRPWLQVLTVAVLNGNTVVWTPSQRLGAVRN
jgi:hypothetical protein